MTQASAPINGTCVPAYTHVREEFERNFRERGEVAAAVCVYQNDKNNGPVGRPQRDGAYRGCYMIVRPNTQ
jgi:hypothetical protein